MPYAAAAAIPPLNTTTAIEDNIFCPEIRAFAAPSSVRARIVTMHAPRNLRSLLSVIGVRIKKVNSGVEPKARNDANVTQPFLKGLSAGSGGRRPCVMVSF